jgi:hypothetical protein
VTTNTNKDFPYIRAWGRMMGSNQSYIDAEVEKAREENAPPTAIYKNSGNRVGWSTYEDITREDTKHLIDALMRNPKP